MTQQPLRLHRFRLSGHSHRVELFLSLLGVPFEMVEVELGKGEHRTPDFLALNPFGQVPVLADGDLVLADSNAILVYLASVYDPDGLWHPSDPVGAAAVQRWLSVAAGLLVNGPAHARLVGIFGAKHDLERAHATALQLFAVMDDQLRRGSGYFVGSRPTIADVALYTYTAHAPEGHLDLDPWPAIRSWLHRIESLPRFVPMVRTAPRFPLPDGA